MRVVAAGPEGDAAIIAGVRARESWAAAALYDALVPRIRHNLRRVLHEPSGDLEDLVQTVLEDVVRTLIQGTFSETCSLRSWASLIASRVAVDRLRAKIRERRVFFRGGTGVPDVNEAVAPQGLERLLEARNEVTLVQAALAEMRPEYSAALVQHELMGHPISEVAVLNGISESAAQSRIFRGRQELLEKLRQKHEGRKR